MNTDQKRKRGRPSNAEIALRKLAKQEEELLWLNYPNEIAAQDPVVIPTEEIAAQDPVVIPTEEIAAQDPVAVLTEDALAEIVETNFVAICLVAKALNSRTVSLIEYRQNIVDYQRHVAHRCRSKIDEIHRLTQENHAMKLILQNKNPPVPQVPPLQARDPAFDEVPELQLVSNPNQPLKSKLFHKNNTLKNHKYRLDISRHRAQERLAQVHAALMRAAEENAGLKTLFV